MNWTESLPADTCRPARDWCETQPDYATAWRACERPDWMFWLLGQMEADRKRIVLAACDIAETVLHHVPEGEDRPRKAIEAARAWTRGEATQGDVQDDASAAYAAYAAANAAYAAYAAATYAAAAYAADAYAAYAADADAADIQKRHCDIIRKHFPEGPAQEEEA
jgi:hypothetical protein